MDAETVTPAVKLKPNRWRTIIPIALLVLVWAVAMVYRMEIRARWWAYRLVTAESTIARRMYVTNLAAIRDRSLGALPRVLADHRPKVREQAIEVLRYCTSDQAANMLLNLLCDDDAEIARKAATALSLRKNATQWLPTLRERTLEDDSPCALGAAIAVGQIADRASEAILIEALDAATDPNLRAQLIDGLGLLGSESAVSLLIGALEDERSITIVPASQRHLAEALAAVRPELIVRGVDPAALSDAARVEPTVASVAARALQMIRGTLDSGTVTTRHSNSR